VKTVVVDLDGTLCDTSKRAHLLDKKPRDWEAYSNACGADEPITEVVDVVRSLFASRWDIVLVSGRGSGARAQTVAWLDKHDVPFNALYLRPDGDYRSNPELKRELIAGLDADLAIDDHPGVAKAYAELGVPTLIVARPNADQGILVEVAEGLSGKTAQLPGPVAEALSTARDTFARKNADYAKDDAWRSNFDAIASQMGFDAVAACDTLIAVKQARLQALKANDRDPSNEAVIDTYLDRMVYSIIAFALLLDEAV
jgi:uncharacterized HAD superfamily protein